MTMHMGVLPSCMPAHHYIVPAEARRECRISDTAVTCVCEPPCELTWKAEPGVSGRATRAVNQ